MNETIEDLQQVRSRICDMVITASAIFAIPAVFASLFRITTIGWQWTMAVHIAATVFIWCLFIFRKSIPYKLRAGSIVSIFLFIGLAGFWQIGMIAGANPVLIVAPLLATVLFGKRLGILYAVAIVLIMIVTAYSFIYGGRPYKIELTVDSVYLPSWITYVFTVVLAVAASIAAISMSNHHLASALIKSRQSQNELTALNKDLENQVSKRTQELQDAKKYAEQQARTDVLTGLNNRRAFFEYAEVMDSQARRYKHTYAIAMIDIDHFKSVNDTCGHDAGDVALNAVGQLILKSLRETDIIGRIGGEEFAVILPETGTTEGAALVDRLRRTIEDAIIETPKDAVRLTASIGIAALEDPNDPLERVMANADAALYRAKNTGRNKIEVHQGKFRASLGA